METITYGLIGAEDLKRGRSTFETTLGDGRVVALSEVNLDSFDKLLSEENTVTNATSTVLTLRHTVSDGSTPAAGIGTALIFQTESIDENPSDAMSLEVANDDVAASTEDTTFWVKLRVAGAALARKFGFRNTGTNYFLLSGAATVDRTQTLQDVTDTFVYRASTDTLTNKTATDMANNAGTGTETFRANGHISVDPTAVATGANTTETDLISYSLPLNTLSANNRGVRIRAWGQVAANASTKTIRLYFGNSVVVSNNISTAPNSVAWLFEGEVFRTGSSTQDSIGRGQCGSIAQSITFVQPTEDTTAAITIKITGQNGTATSSDITAEGLTIEYLNG